MLQVRILPGLQLRAEPPKVGVDIMFGKVGGFLQETRQELNKVTWPSRHELWQATLVVIFTTMILALYIGVVDFILSALIRTLLG